MKKITMLAFLSFCAIGFGQNSSQDQSKEIKAPTGIYAQTAELPAAYFNTTATTVGEKVGVVSSGPRDTNVTVPFTGTYFSNRPDAMLYDNGPYFNVAGSPDLSVLESVTLGMGTYGAGAQFTAGNSIADDVVLTEDVDVTSIDVFAYQTGEIAPSITAVYLQVWDGDPSGGGATVIWGDLSLNILQDATYADANRVLEDDQGATNRQIQRVSALTDGLSLSAGTYWIEYTFEGSGASGPWAPPIAILGETTTGNSLQNQSGLWVPLEDVGPQGLPFVMYGEVTGGGGSFPDPYCGPLEFNNGIEPITLVDVAGISNVSDATVGGTPAHEDFTAIEGDMEEGMTYAIALEGNTDGGFTNSFTVFIDWNQDGVLDNDSERYEIGTIFGSTGTDGQQATGDIVVPSGVTAGQTRMRVIKKFQASYATDSCTPGSGYGQAEDYTINVTGGGGTGGDCEQEHPIAGDGNGGSGSSVDSDFTSAADIVVAAGEDFTLDTIEVSFLTFAPEDAPITANVIYYEDAAGLPGAEIGTETVVPTILSSGEWVNPVAFRFDTSLDMTPFTFDGDAGSDTSYWIGIEMGTATNQATVFWLYTDGAGIEGEPMAQYNAVDGFWTVPEPTREVGYVFSGECSPLSVADNTLGGFTFYPNPTSGSLSLSSVSNIDSVAIYNLLGQKVMDVKVEATTSEINISGLNTGTYIMKVSVEGQIGTYKVLKN